MFPPVLGIDCNDYLENSTGFVGYKNILNFIQANFVDNRRRGPQFNF